MLKINKSINVNGQVYVEAQEEKETIQKQVAYLNATIGSNGEININKSIQDSKLFNENKAAVQNDFTEFENKIYEMSTTATV